jgi:protein-S-isoprenylcysteine O-methyltransferase Ste14
VIRVGQFFFKYRDYLFPLVFLPLALGTKPRMLFDDPSADRWLDLIGLLTLAAGQGLRALVIGFCYIGRSGKRRAIHATQILQEGVFAHCRNPLYVGNMLMVTGLVLVHNGRWMYIVVLPFFVVVYASIVVAEEAFLLGEFGAEYAEYSRRVPRFLPKLAGIRKTLGSASLDWNRIARLEHAPAFASFSAAMCILAWERVATRGFTASEPRVFALALAWLLMLGVYARVRVLKKRGELSHS